MKRNIPKRKIGDSPIDDLIDKMKPKVCNSHYATLFEVMQRYSDDYYLISFSAKMPYLFLTEFHEWNLWDHDYNNRNVEDLTVAIQAFRYTSQIVLNRLNMFEDEIYIKKSSNCYRLFLSKLPNIDRFLHFCGFTWNDASERFEVRIVENFPDDTFLAFCHVLFCYLELSFIVYKAKKHNVSIQEGAALHEQSDYPKMNKIDFSKYDQDSEHTSDEEELPELTVPRHPGSSEPMLPSSSGKNLQTKTVPTSNLAASAVSAHSQSSSRHTHDVENKSKLSKISVEHNKSPSKNFEYENVEEEVFTPIPRVDDEDSSHKPGNYQVYVEHGKTNFSVEKSNMSKNLVPDYKVTNDTNLKTSQKARDTSELALENSSFSEKFTHNSKVTSETDLNKTGEFAPNDLLNLTTISCESELNTKDGTAPSSINSAAGIADFISMEKSTSSIDDSSNSSASIDQFNRCSNCNIDQIYKR